MLALLFFHAREIVLPSGRCERGCVGEEKEQRAAGADCVGRGGGNVEVEERRVNRGDAGLVGVAEGVVGRFGGGGDNQMRELEGP